MKDLLFYFLIATALSNGFLFTQWTIRHPVNALFKFYLFGACLVAIFLAVTVGGYVVVAKP